MTTFANDPIRVKMTLDDVWNLILPKGIDGCFFPGDHKDEYFAHFVASDTNPHNPEEEKYRDDIDRLINDLKVTQDHIREFGPHSHFNTKNLRVIETVLDEKVFGKENRYDVLLDKTAAKRWHYLADGRKFGVIEGCDCSGGYR